PEEVAPHTLLSKREREVLSMLAKGMSINEISTLLAISNKTVSTHKSNLMDKMSLTNFADLFRYASEHGLIR
ncbi:MAG: LuxR C-terminal-related transcriptional regulator, partial [Gallionella sp.]